MPSHRVEGAGERRSSSAAWGLSPAAPVPTVLSQDIPHIFALTLFEDYVYWTDWETKSINRAHKTTGANKTLLISTLHRPMDLHVFHALRQPDGERARAGSRHRLRRATLRGDVDRIQPGSMQYHAALGITPEAL